MYHHFYFTGSLCTSIIAFQLCLFSDCTTRAPQLPSIMSVTSTVKDSCGLPPLMLMFCIPISVCQCTCAKELSHICMFSQSVSCSCIELIAAPKHFCGSHPEAGSEGRTSCVALGIHSSACGRAVGVSLIFSAGVTCSGSR